MITQVGILRRYDANVSRGQVLQDFTGWHGLADEHATFKLLLCDQGLLFPVQLIAPH
jgi:hypothetical protein